MNTDFFTAIEAIEKEKGIDKEVLYEAIEAALLSAYKRNYNATATNARIEINRDSGDIKVFGNFKVVEEVSNPKMEVSVEDARQVEPNAAVDQEVEMEITPREFGRIAAQTAKQVVIQRIREAEREVIYESFVDKEQDIVTGIVQRFEQKNVIIDLGKTEAILPTSEQIPQEKYEQSRRIKVYVYEVKKTTKGPQVMVSRTHSGLLKRLFELEVPEIYEGLIEIKGVAREPGYRSKLAVYSSDENIDPVGACVGPRGARVQTISNELKGEKIDVIKWHNEPEVFISNALSPAKITSVKTDSEQKKASVIVPDDQLSLAIGKEGQNARLAARISGWKIDIISESKLEELEEKGEVSTQEADGALEIESEDIFSASVERELKEESDLDTAAQDTDEGLY